MLMTLSEFNPFFPMSAPSSFVITDFIPHKDKTSKGKHDLKKKKNQGDFVLYVNYCTMLISISVLIFWGHS